MYLLSDSSASESQIINSFHVLCFFYPPLPFGNGDKKTVWDVFSEGLKRRVQHTPGPQDLP